MDNRNYDINKLNELHNMLTEIHNINKYIGSKSVMISKGQWSEGTGLRGRLGKVEGLLRWADSDNGRNKLVEQANEAKRPTFSYIINWKLIRTTEIEKINKELKECLSQLSAETKRLTTWESDNPDYKGLDLDFVNMLLDDSGPTPDTRTTDEMQDTQNTEESETMILSRILNSKI
jgi:hypothetical protein